MHRSGLILKAVLATFLLAALFCAQAVAEKGAAPKGHAGGSSSVVEGVTVVTLSGSPEEMGRQHGRLMAGRFDETAAAFDSLMPRIPGGAIGRWILRQFVMFQVGRIEKRLNEREIAELKGLASTHPEGKGDYRELLYYHVLQDIGQIYACTGAGAAGSASGLPGPIAGRNFDLDMRGVLEPLKTVFYCRPDEGLAFVSVAWPGMMGVVSGMNEAGLCLMEFSAKSEGTSLTGVPVAFIAKRVLTGARDIDEAVGIIMKTPRMGPNIFLLADCSRVAAVEFDAERVGLREVSDGTLPVANHFLGAGLVKDGKNVRQARYSDSRQRYERMKQLLDAPGPVGADIMLLFFRDHSGKDGKLMAWGDEAAINNIKCAHSVIFDPAGRRLWVSTSPQAYGKFVSFRLAEGRLERAGDLPADGYPESHDGKMAAGSDAITAKAQALMQDGDEAGAVDRLRKALLVDPANYIAANLLGEAYMDDGRISEALAAYGAAAAHAPGGSMAMADALAGRGAAYLRLGKRERAREDFRAAVALDNSEDAVETANEGLSGL